MERARVARAAGKELDPSSIETILAELKATLQDGVGQQRRARRTSRLAEALSRSRIGILHRGRDRRLIEVNDYFCELVGRSAEALDGLTMEAVTHPDDLARLASDWEAAQRAFASPFEIEKRYLRPDGSEVWCQVHVHFVRGADGRPHSHLVVAQDITARRRAEQELRESEEHYRHTVELAPQITWTAALDGAILEVSHRWEEVTGIEPADALGHGWVQALHPHDAGRTLETWGDALTSHVPVDVEYRLLTCSGNYRWFRARAQLRRGEAGEPIRWYGTLEDIDDRKRAEEGLRESEERFRLAATAAGLGIWDYDAVRDRREWSDEFKDMLGLPHDTLPEVQSALALVVPEDRHLLQDLISAVRAGKADHRFEVMLRIRRANDGAERWMRTGGWRIQAPSGRLERVLVTIRDVTEERTAEDRIRYAASYDAMTGLPNRAHFNRLLEETFASRQRDLRPFALVLFDVDHLKETNDSIGHDAGDLLLRTFADRLRATLPQQACVARLGGDEFALVSCAESEEAAAEEVRVALQAMREPFTYEGQALTCQATAGAALFPRDGRNAADLLKSADIALYVGKAGERGTLSLFRPEMHSTLQRRASMLAVARTAVRERRIEPHYQPKVALADRSITGFEALLRWHHDRWGLQGPGTVAAAFDDLNIAIELSDCMFERICADMRDWLDQGLEFGRIAVNLSAAEFRHEQLVPRILGHLDRAGIPPTRLELEVTESVFLGQAPEAVSRILRTFHEQGIRIALDDFGTGYASLTHLKAFPVDVIKIDKSFIANLADDTGDAVIVDAVIGLANRLGIDVVAEGVESDAQANYLAQRGCRYGQGFLFGRGLKSSELPPLLAR